MKQLPSSAARPLIRVAYLLPLIVGVLLLIWACIPHLFFIHNKLPPHLVTHLTVTPHHHKCGNVSVYCLG